ncbi:hypothetical protein [Pseudooceanicola spongiae]|uniref:Uncharacterized protein n=1 Tax=Pseudooceanicola spongiae TaxID=2613965 RepID=A0A7L9WRL8_9RHOB|nr:hypothetical protein [Pseudooceanicola spongiae]QOL82484.1 hypothetical protein F3W81_17655 [Pseudooceanicola spongiae]
MKQDFLIYFSLLNQFRIGRPQLCPPKNAPFRQGQTAKSALNLCGQRQNGLLSNRQSRYPKASLLRDTRLREPGC